VYPSRSVAAVALLLPMAPILNVLAGMRVHRQQRGIAMIFTVLALPILLGMASLAIDTGLIYSARTQMQNAADGAALAAMKALRDTGSTATVASEAAAVAALNKVQGTPVAVDPNDVEIGYFDEASRVFSTGAGFGVPAVRVTVSAPVDLNFAHFVGFADPNVGASATVAIRRRDLVIVQDRSGSFFEEWDDALDADRDLVTAMEAQALAGDQVGVVRFWNQSVEDIALTDIGGGGATTVRNTISSLQACQNGGSESCYTHTFDGIDQAVQTIENSTAPGTAERVMVIVSDGLACMSGGGHDPAHALALTAADNAAAAGISIFVITLSVPGGPSGECYDPPSGMTKGERNAELVRGFGKAFETPNADQLDELAVSIIQEMPFFLVR